MRNFALSCMQVECDAFEDICLVEVEHWMAHVCHLLEGLQPRTQIQKNGFRVLF